MPNNIYYKQAELLLRVLPVIMRVDAFALKGGTAINFFWRKYPRLSVDIDLTYIKVKPRDESLSEISDALKSIESDLKKIFRGIEIVLRLNKEKNLANGLTIKYDEATIKVEVNTVIRGTVYPVVEKKLCNKAEQEFELSVTARTLSLEDLYGGKICAALDRQHPRDLFDIKLLLESEGLTDKIRKAFIVYLISHDRPMVELLNPNLKDITQIFENEFRGMTMEPVELHELISARKTLIEAIKSSLTKDEINFLLSFKSKNPDWSLLGLDQIEKLPAVQWKLLNLNRMKPKMHEQAYKKLEEYLIR
ncbi:MAG: nucleotidyl transferase AbiEii/AbiGii toxin family protein [Bacteroidetes bacterium]|nr:nucleotidyl transferase AbiEii/AbiGii toxin family protein [Bacteroidota bacterium]